MVLGSSLGAFLGTVFFAFLCAYILFNLKADQEVKRQQDGSEVIEHNIKHKFLQLILWGLILLSLIINAVAVMDMSSQTCEWLKQNETTMYTYNDSVPNSESVLVNTTRTYAHAYQCTIDENSAATQYQNLLYRLAIPLIGFYIIIYFIVMLIAKVQRMRREDRRRQGR